MPRSPSPSVPNYPRTPAPQLPGGYKPWWWPGDPGHSRHLASTPETPCRCGQQSVQGHRSWLEATSGGTRTRRSPNLSPAPLPSFSLL